MERSTIHVLAKRGKSLRQIAKELGRNRRTVARVLREPLDQQPAKRARRSKVDPFRSQIEAWLQQGLSAVRMLELARTDPEHPYTGGRSVFGDMVRRIRADVRLQQTIAAVPIRFEGLPAEFLQVDWGEVRRFPFSHQPPATRYFLACRLKYSRWSWIRFTTDMRQETLFRDLVDCCLALGWVPWVLVFDNMKTVTSGRDASHHPLWTPALLQLAREFGFHPQACDPGAANQKGSVESLVKWVKGNFLAGRNFRDDDDLAEQQQTWLCQVNTRPSAATGAPPSHRLPLEAAQGGALPPTAGDYGLVELAQVSAEALVAINGNRYSVPVAHVGAPVTVRLHRSRIRIWRDHLCIAEHPRALDGARRRVVDPSHYAPLFGAKPRAQAMLYRELLLELGGAAVPFVTELSRCQRGQLSAELRAVYLLYEQYGTAALLNAMRVVLPTQPVSAAALAQVLSHAAPTMACPAPLLSSFRDLPSQAEVDRRLSDYEAWVEINEALPEVLG